MADHVVVTLDGTVHDANTPLLYADDLAVVRGDGVFETLLVRGGTARKVGRHLERLTASAAALDLPAPDADAWRRAIEIAAAEWGSEHEGLLRLILSRGREGGGEPTQFLTIGPLAARVASVRVDGISVITLARGFSVDLAAVAPWQLLSAKTLSYATNMAALRHAAREGADDVIFLSSEGNVLEGPRSTVVIAREKTLVTPPVEQGILPGTTQRALFEVAQGRGYECAVQPLRPADLIAADGVWMISSVTLAARVHTFNGLTLPVPEIAQEVTEMVDIAVESVD